MQKPLDKSGGRVYNVIKKKREGNTTMSKVVEIFTVTTDRFADIATTDILYVHERTFFAVRRGENIGIYADSIEGIKAEIIRVMGVAPVIVALNPEYLDDFMKIRGWYIGSYYHIEEEND